MSFYVASFHLADLSSLGRYRTLPDLWLSTAEGVCWLRGPETAVDWASLPALGRFHAASLAETGPLTQVGHRVPSRSMPAGPWQLLKDFLRPQPPPTNLSSQPPAPVPWVLEPSGSAYPTALLLLPLAVLAEWVNSAPSIRSRPLRFCASQTGQACVIGKPLPALPGEHWWAAGSILMPAGYALPAGITHGLVAQSLSLRPGELALLRADGSYDRIASEAWLPCSASNLHATTSS
jgi:hypothetical protein